MRTLDLLHVERDRGYGVLDIEVEEFVRIIQRRGGQHRDDIERNMMVAQHPHAAQYVFESAAAFAGHTVTIVKEIGSIDADPDLDATTPDKFTPRVVYQGGVGLERLGHLEPADVAPFQCEGGLLVE